MEKELEKNMEFVNKRSRLLGTADTMQHEDENVKEILREVLNELYSKKTKVSIVGDCIAGSICILYFFIFFYKYWNYIFC